eukprot:224581-Prorocentrum_minimum.AAC.1
MRHPRAALLLGCAARAALALSCWWITVPLYYCASVLYTPVLLDHWITVRCTAPVGLRCAGRAGVELLVDHCTTAVLLYYRITAPLYYCTTVLLYYWINGSLCTVLLRSGGAPMCGPSALESAVHRPPRLATQGVRLRRAMPSCDADADARRNRCADLTRR